MQKATWEHSLSIRNLTRKLLSVAVQVEAQAEDVSDGILVQMPEGNTGRHGVKMLKQHRSILMLKMNRERQKNID